MAESCAIAFGRYLRTLRERKGYSLDEVAALSRTFADPVAKSYLSRVENGRIHLALPKLIPLSRIYEIPPEGVLERLELDLELDKVGGPDTAGKDYAELTEKGKSALEHGALWEAYALLRDSLHVARTSPLMGRLRDHTEQLLCAVMNLCSAAMKLGRARLALHELDYVRVSNGLSPRVFPILLERLATTYRALDQLDQARAFADQAIAEAERVGTTEFLGYFYGNRALIAEREGNWEEALSLHQRAFKSFQDAGQQPECARTLLNISQAYFSAGRHRSARRALVAAERLAVPLKLDRTRALIRLLLGQLDEVEKRPLSAEKHWREAALFARDLKDKIIQFQAEYFLYKRAIGEAQMLTARALERKLVRLSPWIPSSVEELGAFRELQVKHGLPGKKRVAPSQHHKRVVGN